MRLRQALSPRTMAVCPAKGRENASEIEDNQYLSGAKYWIE